MEGPSRSDYLIDTWKSLTNELALERVLEARNAR